MSIMSHFFLSLSASTPILGGKLLAKDTRIDTLEKTSDDRNLRERNAGTYPKYSFNHRYISNDLRNKKHYNDRKQFLNKKFRKKLIQKARKKKLKIDKNLLNHLSDLF